MTHTHDAVVHTHEHAAASHRHVAFLYAASAGMFHMDAAAAGPDLTRVRLRAQALGARVH